MDFREQEKCAWAASESTKIVRSLNDKLRTNHEGGRLFVTRGICGLRDGAVPLIVSAVAAFDDFSPASDPHAEHDFGVFRFEGHKIFWKIDYYDQMMMGGSPDPADPSVTTRVLTIMLASEY